MREYNSMDKAGRYARHNAATETEVYLVISMLKPVGSFRSISPNLEGVVLKTA